MLIENGSYGWVYRVTFHPASDGMYFFGGMGDGIRRWRVADGQEVGKRTGMSLHAISVTRDAKWVVCGFDGGANVWDAELQRKVVEVEDANAVWAVDVSPESTRFATGTGTNGGKRAGIWSITTGERLVGPLKHDRGIRGIKFSPDGRHIATACEDSIHIFDSYNGDQLITTMNSLPPPKWSAITPIVWPFDGRHPKVVKSSLSIRPLEPNLPNGQFTVMIVARISYLLLCLQTIDSLLPLLVVQSHFGTRQLTLN